MFDKIFGAVLVAAPFFIKYSENVAVEASQAFFLQVTAFLLAVLFGVKTPSTRIKVLAVGVFFVAFTGTDPFGSYQMYQLSMALSGVLFLSAISKNIKLSTVKIIYKALAVVCLAESAWILLNQVGVDPFYEWLSFLNPSIRRLTSTGAPAIKLMVSGSLGNPNHSGAIIAATIPFLHPMMWPIPVLALFFAKSALPIICAVVSVAAFVSYRFKKFVVLYAALFMIFTGAVLLASGLIPEGSFFHGTDRVSAWESLLNLVGFQLWGHGLGYVPTVFSSQFFASQIFLHMHNEIMELYAISGVVGVMVACWFFIPAFKNKGRPAVNACLVSLLINSLGNFTFHIAPLFMVFGACYSIQIQGEENASNRIRV